MENFSWHQPTEIIFGKGRVREAGALAARFGKRCLLVSVPDDTAMKPLHDRVLESLKEAGISVTRFAGVVPNPTVESLDEGARIAREAKVDVVLGVGGGSSMDSAKAIAVAATHEGSAWDYLFFKEKKPTALTLPILAVSTTSGTGSQVTQVAVMTDTASRTKSAIYNPIVYPRACIVDPELMLSIPPHITASTGFDAFCHAFESLIYPAASPYVCLLALEAMNLVAANLPATVVDGNDVERRSALAWADTLAGLCIANGGEWNFRDAQRENPHE